MWIWETGYTFAMDVQSDSQLNVSSRQKSLYFLYDYNQFYLLCLMFVSLLSCYKQKINYIVVVFYFWDYDYTVWAEWVITGVFGFPVTPKVAIISLQSTKIHKACTH